jgi:hypothetical protein
MTSRLPALFGIAILCATAACGDPTRPRAELNVITDTVSLYALNGGPDYAPVAFSVIDGRLRSLNSGLQFDVAVDLDPQGRVVLYPVNLVGNQLASAGRVGIQRVQGTFEALTRAPRSGYQSDSAVVLRPGEVAAVQVSNPVCLYSTVGAQMYGKFAVDSVSLPQRQIFGKLATDPNCGFRSLEPGLPKE